jgi:AraC-like DNA-binding protein
VSWAAGHLWDAGYREWLPPAPMRASISCLWVSVLADDSGMSVTNVLPDGCVDLFWQHGHGAYIAGPDTGPAPAEHQAGTIIVGARFRPGAGGTALGMPLALLRDQRVELADCLPDLAARLPADLRPDDALTRVIQLTGQLVAHRPPDPLVLHGVRMITSGRTSVAELGPALAVSERQLRRRFDSAVGYGPKMLHRVLRFRRALDQLTAGPGLVDLATLALQVGYADQAHLTRETTSLAGLPPAALVRSRQAA